MGKNWNIPNLISIIRLLILTPLIAYFFLEGENYIALILSIILIFSDIIDGLIARKLNQATQLGTVLDAVGDNAFVAILAFVFLYLGYINLIIIALILAHRLTRLLPTIFFWIEEKGFYMPYYMKFTGISLFIYLFLIPFLNNYLGGEKTNLITIIIILSTYIPLLLSSIYVVFFAKKEKLKIIKFEKKKLENTFKDKIKQNLKQETTIANIITMSRTILVGIALIFLKEKPFILAILISIAILLDAADGFMARKYGGSKFGALVDIGGDRIVEVMVLFTYAAWGLISYIFPIIFLIRGLSTDFIRILNYIYPAKENIHPLSLGKAINRPMRVLSGISKLLAFTIILINPEIGIWLMWFALIINLVRGIPAIFNKKAKELFQIFFRKILG